MPHFEEKAWKFILNSRYEPHMRHDWCQHDTPTPAMLSTAYLVWWKRALLLHAVEVFGIDCECWHKVDALDAPPEKEMTGCQTCRSFHESTVIDCCSSSPSVGQLMVESFQQLCGSEGVPYLVGGWNPLNLQPVVTSVSQLTCLGRRCQWLLLPERKMVCTLFSKEMVPPITEYWNGPCTKVWIKNFQIFSSKWRTDYYSRCYFMPVINFFRVFRDFIYKHTLYSFPSIF